MLDFISSYLQKRKEKRLQKLEEKRQRKEKNQKEQDFEREAENLSFVFREFRNVIAIDQEEADAKGRPDRIADGFRMWTKPSASYRAYVLFDKVDRQTGDALLHRAQQIKNANDTEMFMYKARNGLLTPKRHSANRA